MPLDMEVFLGREPARARGYAHALFSVSCVCVHLLFAYVGVGVELQPRIA